MTPQCRGKDLVEGGRRKPLPAEKSGSRPDAAAMPMPPCCFARSRAKVDGSALDGVNYPPVTSELLTQFPLSVTHLVGVAAAPSAHRCWLGLFSHGGGRGCESGNESDHGRGPCRGRGHGRSRRGGDHNRGHCAHRDTQVQLRRPSWSRRAEMRARPDAAPVVTAVVATVVTAVVAAIVAAVLRKRADEGELWREASSPEARVSSPEAWSVRGRSRRRRRGRSRRRRGRSLQRGALAGFFGGA